MTRFCVDVSIVSHGHGSMVEAAISQLKAFPEISKIILTRNTPEPENTEYSDDVLVISNKKSKGFAENHNAAFSNSMAPFFCILNPDIVFTSNPFPVLVAELLGDSGSIVAPLVVNGSGDTEDSARQFPTVRRLISKVIGLDDGRFWLQANRGSVAVDWIGGMFMLVPSDDFRAIGGFDEDFFLYYEDVDLCTRFWLSGRSVKVCTNATVIHHAQRTSHKNLRYLKWHISSLARYFYKHWGRLPKGGSE